MSKTTIVLSRNTHDTLQALGRKGETFNELVMGLVEQRTLNSNSDITLRMQANAPRRSLANERNRNK